MLTMTLLILIETFSSPEEEKLPLSLLSNNDDADDTDNDAS